MGGFVPRPNPVRPPRLPESIDTMLDRWLACVARLESEIPAQQFKPWIKPLVFLGYDAGERLLRLGVPNHFKLNWVKSQFESRIETIARDAIDPDLRVSFEIHRAAADADDTAPAAAARGASADPDAAGFDEADVAPSVAFDPFDQPEASLPNALTRLRPELTFDTFVHGKANQIAWSAALQVVERPGTAYNPLFLYGGVGLGKTHLLHAVGNAILERKPAARVRYIHAQDYFDEMVRGIQRKSLHEFKKKYQSLDLLLIDDIQFLGGKERTQEEFFYTFEALLTARKQLIITSDTYPKELSAFEDRLVSRFGSGLIVEIEPPELEMRVAILLAKAQQSRVRLDEQVAFFVAKHIRSNVRELEGALKRIVAYANFHGQEISLALTKEALRDLLAVQNRQISVENIQKTVADYYKIRPSEMHSKKRSRAIARPRQVAMALAKELTQLSLPEIGSNFGGRDHTTVLHACRQIAKLRESLPDLNHDVNFLLQVLRS